MQNDFDYSRDHERPNDIDPDGDIIGMFTEGETVWMDKGCCNQARVSIIDFIGGGYCTVNMMNQVIEVNIFRLSKT